MNATLANALTSPLSDERANLLLRLTDGLDSAALQWLSGYTAGLAVQLAPNKGQLHAVPGLEPQHEARLTIIYGSQTGNARREAEALQQQVLASGLQVRLLRADAYPVKDLASESLLYVVISTQGEGDPPDDAIAFVDYLGSRRAPRLNALKFAVLGLGDSSYPLFNAVAKKIDARLAELGAERLAPIAEADIDVATVANPWREQAIQQARDAQKISKPSAQITTLRPTQSETFSKDKPHAAELLINQRITARSSEQDVRHLEIALHEHLSYEPGDALGVWARNNANRVTQLIQTLGISADSSVKIGEQTHSLHEWLSSHREISRLSKSFLQQHAERSNASELNDLLGSNNTTAIANYLSHQHVIDVLRQHPADWDATDFVQVLRPMTPRLYSIASSQKAVGHEAHLTVALANYTREATQAFGVASGYLAQRQEGETLPVFIEHNERFRLPQDGSRDILMIGPGTGVAPFRAFVQERVETGATGKNWL
ncbi:MAG: flavodoxin domain-containing protein, partial [Arenimonas sp.]|nr:flavodoxin domain-containing protein [Arenimonas sp.]